MHTETEPTPTKELVGLIQSIDAPYREMTVAVDGALRSLHIAAECSVWLHGERVKLRILQPLDAVRIAYFLQDGDCVATQIRVK